MGKVILIVSIFPTWTHNGYTHRVEMPSMEACAAAVKVQRITPGDGYAICIPSPDKSP